MRRQYVWKWALSVFLLLVAVMPAQLQAQPFILISPTPEQGGEFGKVSKAGDVNGDGFDDVIVGAFSENPGSSPSGAGRAHVFSGKDTSLLYTLVSPTEVEAGRFGVMVAGGGDVNNDGFSDVMVGATTESHSNGTSSAGRVHVFSGQDASVLYSIESPNPELGGLFGGAVSDAGDLNRDGFDDIIVGAAWETPESHPSEAGRVYVYSGKTGEVIFPLVSPNPEAGGWFGYAVSNAGDVNGDSLNDIVVGTRFESFDSRSLGSGRAYLFSGADGNLLRVLNSPYPERLGQFGAAVSGVGDVNHDGFDDVVVGAPAENHRDEGEPSVSGRAYVFSGLDGQVIYPLISPSGQIGAQFGVSVSKAGDVNGDRFEDILVGAYTDRLSETGIRSGLAYIFSGQSGDVLHELASPNAQSNGLFGGSVSGAGDVNDDGYTDVVIGAVLEDVDGVENAGHAYVFNGLTGTILPVALIGFKALIDLNSIVLSWQTASETDNAGFSVEYRSMIQHDRVVDGQGSTWTRIGWVEGAGSTQEPQSYTFHHSIEAPGRHQFRLKQIDFDGAFEYSPVVEALVEVPGLVEVGAAYPHPVTGRSVFSLTLRRDTAVKVSLYDVLGRLVRSLYDGVMPGTQVHKLSLDGTGLSGGLYIIEIKGANFRVVRPVAIAGI